jgi:hypothetical protein
LSVPIHDTIYDKNLLLIPIEVALIESIWKLFVDLGDYWRLWE